MPIKTIQYSDLGTADYGWLKAKYHFSFANYYHPNRMNFGNLRVINDDWIAAGRGFPMHGHDNMEIITIIRQGQISHRDSLGHSGIIAAGEIQIMSAGTGILHEEYNRGQVDTNLYQIWVETNKRNIAPRWESMKFSNNSHINQLQTLASGDESDENCLFIHADSRIYQAFFDKITTINHKTRAPLHYILCNEGDIAINGIPLSKGDAAECTNVDAISIASLNKSASVFIIECQ